MEMASRVRFALDDTSFSVNYHKIWPSDLTTSLRAAELAVWMRLSAVMTTDRHKLVDARVSVAHSACLLQAPG